MHKLNSVVIVLLGTPICVSAFATADVRVDAERLDVSHHTPITKIDISPITDLIQYLRLSFTMVDLEQLFKRSRVSTEPYTENEVYWQRVQMELTKHNFAGDDDDDWDKGNNDDWDADEYYEPSRRYTHFSSGMW
jgi:hypothetical protein